MTTESTMIDNAVHHPSVVTLIEAILGSKEGEMWVGEDGTYYNKPSIDWEKIKDLSKNHLVTEQLERLTSLLFMERPQYRVLDSAEDDKEVEGLSAALSEMFNSKGVRIHVAMKRAWIDRFLWGCSLWNPVWSRPSKGKAVLSKLRHLPCETFGEGPLGGQNEPGRIFSQILQGITLSDASDDDSIEFWQQQARSASPVQLKNVWMVKDPSSEELGGTSRLAPLVPAITAYDFAVKALGQMVNRGGAPILLMKVTSPTVDDNRDDVAFAQKIVRNLSKDTGYVLRDNMEPHVVDTKPNRVSLDAVEYFERRIRVYMSPATIISTEGPTLGEGTAAKMDVLTEWMKGEHEWLESAFEELGNMWLQHNGYSSNLRCDITIPVPDPEDPVTDVAMANAMHITQSGTKDEIREKLGLEKMDQRTRRQLEVDYKPVLPPNPFGSIFPSPPPAEDGEMFKQWEHDDPQLSNDLEEAARKARDRILAAAKIELEEG